jgi:hypothetical protein
VLKEANINLDMALALQALLEQSGQRVMLTRTDDSHDLSTRDRYPLANEAQATPGGPGASRARPVWSDMRACWQRRHNWRSL